MRVEQLWRYPVKSLGGERCAEVTVDDHGMVGDRRWGIEAVATGKMLTARREPALLFGAATVVGDDVRICLPDGAVAADDAALSAWLGYAVRLVAAAPGVRATHENPLDFENDADWMEWTGPAGVFHDSKRDQVSLLSYATIGGWDRARFRANVMLDVGPEDELVGRRIRIGTVELDVVKPVERCVMTTRPQPGLERDLDVLRTINRDRSGTLAVASVVVVPGTMREGDAVEVL